MDPHILNTRSIYKLSRDLTDALKSIHTVYIRKGALKKGLFSQSLLANFSKKRAKKSLVQWREIF